MFNKDLKRALFIFFISLIFRFSFYRLFTFLYNLIRELLNDGEIIMIQKPSMFRFFFSLRKNEARSSKKNSYKYAHKK